MSAEDRNGEVSTDEKCTDCTTQESSFDAVARGVANGTVSRRRALRLLGAALVGSVLAPRVAGAQDLGDGIEGSKCMPLAHKCLTNIDCCSRFCDKNGNQCACTPEEIACMDPSSGHLKCVPRCKTSSDPCKIDACNPVTGGCVVANAPSTTPCETGNLCTLDFCDNGTCKQGDLDPEIICGQCFRCKPSSGLCEVDPAKVGQRCNDDDPCTVEDKCTPTGTCVGTPKDCSDNNECTTDVCNPTTGVCEHTPLTGTPCDDDNPCTLGDTCRDGQCVGELVDCGQCLRCDPSDGLCEPDPDQIGDACNDNDPCTVNDVCLPSGTCRGTPKDCSDNNECTTDVCNPTTGVCEHTPLTGTPCSDNNRCTIGDICENGQCVGEAVNCQQCLKCNPQNGTCEPDPDQIGKTCNDNDPCTVNDRCLATGVCAGTPKDCSDNNECTADFCNPTTGVCEHTPLTDTPCSDNNRCTTGDICKNGQCVGEAVNCQQCLKCNPQNGTCEPDPDRVGKSCNDGDPCTENDQCTATGTCVGTPKVCPGSQVCVNGTCQCPAGTCGGTTCAGRTCGTNNCCTGTQVCCPPGTRRAGTCRPTSGACNM